MNEAFYYLRHGQTDGNLSGRMCGGDWDLDLNATGRAQIRAAEELFATARVKISSIAVSPMLRARTSARGFERAFALEAVVNEDLREWRIGAWDRQPFLGVKDAVLSKSDPPGGEPWAFFRERVARGLDHALTLPAPTLVVAHGFVWDALSEHLGLGDHLIENGTPYRVWSTDAGWRCARLTST